MFGTLSALYEMMLLVLFPAQRRRCTDKSKGKEGIASEKERCSRTGYVLRRHGSGPSAVASGVRGERERERERERQSKTRAAFVGHRSRWTEMPQSGRLLSC